MKRLRVSVTGASGFIGRFLCAGLATQGCDVTAVVRSDATKVIGATRTVVVPDLRQSPDAAMFAECQVVIHLAGRAHVMKEFASDPLAEYRASNVEVSRNLLLLAARAGVQRFVFVSSIGVNGRLTTGAPFCETTKENPHDLYAVSKLEAEREIESLAAGYGIEFVIVRPTLVYGPGAPGNFGMLVRLASKGLPLPFGRLSAKRSLISIWNLVDFLALCATHPAGNGETFLIADEGSVVIAEIFEHLGIGMGKRQRILSIPEGLLGSLAALCGRRRSFEKLNAELVVDIGKAKTMLGWEPPLSTHAALQRTGSEYMRKRIR